MIDMARLTEIQNDLQKSKTDSEIQISLTARAAGITVMPNPMVEPGKPLLLVHPDTWAALAEAGHVKPS